MYKWLFNHLYDLSKHNVLYRKQFGFQESLSTEYAIMQLTDRINNNLENNGFTLGTFINFSKVFNTVDYQMLIPKLKNHGVKGRILNWFKSYLKNRKQYLLFKNS